MQKKEKEHIDRVFQIEIKRLWLQSKLQKKWSLNCCFRTCASLHQLEMHLTVHLSTGFVHLVSVLYVLLDLGLIGGQIGKCPDATWWFKGSLKSLKLNVRWSIFERWMPMFKIIIFYRPVCPLFHNHRFLWIIIRQLVMCWGYRTREDTQA